MKLLFNKEWLMKAIEAEGDESCEAGRLHPEAPRFFIDHGAIHDRNTGKHVRTCDCVFPIEGGQQAALTLLNNLDMEARKAFWLEQISDRLQSELTAARKALEEERERCAKVCEAYIAFCDRGNDAARHKRDAAQTIASGIRALPSPEVKP